MPRRVDANQREIVRSLRLAGASVHILSEVGDGCPDILVGWRGKNYLLEIKTDSGKLTKDQEDWHREWRGEVSIVRSLAEAFATLTAT